MISVSGFENTRELTAESFRLHVYGLNPANPSETFTFDLDREAAAKLFAYLEGFSIIKDTAQGITGKIVELSDDVSDDLLRRIRLTSGAVLKLVRTSPSVVKETIADFVEQELDDRDLVALKYRKKELARMSNMIANPGFFESYAKHHNASGPETPWQRFFEQNHWVFGYGLSYIIGDAFSPKRLEQVTSGFSVAGPGKRVDALLRTAGRIQSLAFCEIKGHRGPKGTLVEENTYRVGVWQESKELSGAVAQVRHTVEEAMLDIRGRFEVDDEDGNFVEEFYNYRPQAFVVMGTLAEFVDDNGRINSRKFRAFDMYRHGLKDVQVLTYDELLGRARMIVEGTEQERARSPEREE